METAQNPAIRDRMERFAQAYMMYFGGPDSRELRTINASQRAAMRAHFERRGIPTDAP